MHETRIQLQEMLQELVEFGKPNGITPLIETVSAPPLRTSIMATWSNVNGAKGYLLDVSTSASFSSYVAGYHDLDVGNVNGRAVTGLNRGTTFYIGCVLTLPPVWAVTRISRRLRQKLPLG